MNCFEIGKYQSVDENLLYISMNIYELIDKPINIDKLFSKYSEKYYIDLNVNFERLLFLALTFLFGLDLIEGTNEFIRRKR